MKRIVSMILVLVATIAVMAQTSWQDEKLRYGMYLGPIKAGEAELITRNITYNGQEAVQMDLIARTTSAAEKIFSLNDTLTTIVRPDDSSPVYFQKHCFEGDDIVREKVNFSKDTNGNCVVQMTKYYKDGHVKECNETSNTLVYDMVSVVGFARTMDTNGLKKGQRMNFRLADACDILEESLIFQGWETVRISGRKYNCMMFKLVEPYVEKGKKKDREILNIYVCDDEARTIVQMDIKFKVGTAKAKIIN